MKKEPLKLRHRVKCTDRLISPVALRLAQAKPKIWLPKQNAGLHNLLATSGALRVAPIASIHGALKAVANLRKQQQRQHSGGKLPLSKYACTGLSLSTRNRKRPTVKRQRRARSCRIRNKNESGGNRCSGTTGRSSTYVSDAVAQSSSREKKFKVPTEKNSCLRQTEQHLGSS